jgi:hypothetical protein
VGVWTEVAVERVEGVWGEALGLGVFKTAFFLAGVASGRIATAWEGGVDATAFFCVVAADFFLRVAGVCSGAGVAGTTGVGAGVAGTT